MASKSRYNKYSNYEIPTHIGVIVLMLAGLITAFITIRIGDKIIKSAPDSKAFSADKQLQQEIINTK